MPRASNRVGVELDAVSAASSTSPSADLLKAKKAARRARVRQRAEEKRLKVVAQMEAETFDKQGAISPEHELDSEVLIPPASQQPVPVDEGVPTCTTGSRRPAGRELKVEKLQTPGAEDEPLVVANDDAHEHDKKSNKRKSSIVGYDETLLDQQLQQQQRQKSLMEAEPPLLVEVTHSSLEEARAEFGTEEVINVDAYVSKLNAIEQNHRHQQQIQQSPPLVLAQDKVVQQPQQEQQHKKKKQKQDDKPSHTEAKKPTSTTTSPDVAAFRIQKALKKKFLNKTLKKCASFLRHSPKVFAEVDFAGLSQSPATPRSALPSLSQQPRDAANAPQSAGQRAKSPWLQQQLQQQDRDPGGHSGGDIQSRRSSQDKVVDHVGTRQEKRLPNKGPKQKRNKDRGKRDRRQDFSSSCSASSSASEDSGHPSNSEREEGDSAFASSSSSRSSRSSRTSSSASSSGSPSLSASSSSSDTNDRVQNTKRKKAQRAKISDPDKKPNNSKEKEDRTDSTDAPLGPTSALLQEVIVSDHPNSEAGEADDGENNVNSEVYARSIVKIQAWLRGVEGRRRAHIRRVEFEREIESEALYEVHEEASVRIQAIIRGYLIRRQLGIVDKPPASIKKNSKPKKKNRRASITAFFIGEDTAESTRSNERMRTTESPEKRGSAIDEEQDQESINAGRKQSEQEEVAEWPTEFNLEGLDQWEELNSPVNVNDDLVTHAHFLSRGKLRVFCGTWNMHAKKPQDDLRLWIPLNKYHIVAVGSEECVNSIAKSVVFTSKKQWEDLLRETLGEEYVLVSSHSLTAIHNIVFVHESVIPLLSNIQSDAVATGLGNQLGNKGGVGIAFSIGRTSFAFVNCHFDAHQHNTEKRNGNFHRINQELKLYPQQNIPITSSSLPPTSNAVTGQSSLDGLGKTTATRFSLTSLTNATAMGKKLAISECFDRVFWFGDLNYRINGTRRMVDLLLLHNKFDVLRFNDQLQIEMAKGNVFSHFQEGPLHFRPTYKFDKHSNVYDSSGKQRIPSWTDRILYLSNEKPGDIEILSYRSEMTFQTSDHRPVGATFQVSFKSSQELFTAESNEFSRVLARGYKPNQAKSEVCTVQ